MVEIESYSAIADLYDFLYREESDVKYYLEEARKAEGKVLEIGCGTGRVMLKLLEQGVDIEGLDISKKMLEILKRKARVQNLNPKTYLRDMRTFSLKSRYSLIIIPYRTFMHLSSENEKLDTIKRIHKHLNKNGKAIIHTYIPSAAEVESTAYFRPINVSFFRIDNKKITVVWHVKYSPAKDEITYRVSIYKSKDKIHSFDMRLYPTNYEKMKALLKKAGFRSIKAYSDFGGTVFNPGHGRAAGDLIWVAKK